MLLLEREARKETIERKGKNYRFWLFRRKLYHIVTVYALIFGLIGAIVFLWKDYILKYDWLSIDTVTLKSNGIFNSEQAFSVMGIGPQDNIFSIDAAELEQRLKKCPAIRRASVKRQISSNPTLLVDIDARIPVAWIDCPELGIHPGDATYGALADKESPRRRRSRRTARKSACPPSRSGRPVPANSATASASGNWKRP